MKFLGPGQGNQNRRGVPKDVPLAHWSLGRYFSSCNGSIVCPKKPGRNFLAVQTVRSGHVRGIIGSKNPSIHGNESQVLVDALLGSMVPVMIPRHHQDLFDPLALGPKLQCFQVAWKGDEHQIRQNDGLRKSSISGTRINPRTSVSSTKWERDPRSSPATFEDG